MPSQPPPIISKALEANFQQTASTVEISPRWRPLQEVVARYQGLASRLEHVRKAPIMLVGNKADVCAVNLDMAALKEKHENVLDFYPLSCTKYQKEYAAHFERFQADLIKQVAELGVHTVRFGKAHLAVLDELTNRSGKESFLPKNDWLDLCQGSGRTTLI